MEIVYLVMIICLLVLIILGIIWFRNKIVLERRESYLKGQGELFEAICSGGFDSRVSMFKSCNKYAKKSQVVFVGDSITQEYNNYEYYDYKTYNRGIGGDTTVGLLSRMNESVYDIAPKVVVLLIGTNDFVMLDGANSMTIYSNIKQIVDEIKTNLPECKIILQSIYPIYQQARDKIDLSAVGSRTNNVIEYTNNLLKTIQGVRYLDMYSQLIGEDNNLKYEYTRDGLHLNNLGYEFVSKLLNEEIQKEMC